MSENVSSMMLALSLLFVWFGFLNCPFKTLRITSCFVGAVHKLTCDGRVFMPGLRRFPWNDFEACFECSVPAVEHCLLGHYFGFPEVYIHLVVGLFVAHFVGCDSLVADFHLAFAQTNSEEKCDVSGCSSMSY